jgi:hypothetical protein
MKKMKKIILLLTILSIISCKKNIESDSPELKKVSEENNNPKTEINSQLNEEKEYAKEITEDNSPENTALTFINSYIVDCNKMNKSVGYLNFVKSSDLTTKSFKIELQKIVDEAEKLDPEMGLDFDPIIDGQDYPDEGFELKDFDTKTNFIIVKGKNWADFEVTIKLIFENEKWLIDGCGIVNIPKNNQSKR